MTSAQLRTEMKAESRKLSGAKVGIPPRHMKFSRLSKSARYFYGNNATVTLFLAELSSIFPPGERFFVESVRHFRDRIQDETLKAQVSGFIGQESMHGREHERLNALLIERGIDTRFPEKALTMGLRLLERLPHSTQLACTTFMEHFTALLGEALLEDQRFIKDFDPEMLTLWQWHALEELEHKAVAYDVYDAIAGNSHFERQLAPWLVVAALLPAILGGWGYMLARDGVLTDRADLSKGFAALLGKRGFVTGILRNIPLFTARSYHPNKHNTRKLEQKWREKLFGEEGTLNYAYGNRESVAGAVA